MLEVCAYLEYLSDLSFTYAHDPLTFHIMYAYT